MAILDNALDALARGFKVFPLRPRAKLPAGEAAPCGVRDATGDESRIRRWWDSNSGYNIGITGGVIVDVDEGVTSLDDLRSFSALNNLPPTLTVRTGRRPGMGIQLHYRGESQNRSYTFAGLFRGEIRSINQYGLWAGSIHPTSGEQYEILIDRPRAVWPSNVNLGSRAFSAGDSKRDHLTSAEAVKEKFEELLGDAARAVGGRNHSAHRCAWYACRASMGGILDEVEVKKRIFDVVNLNYRAGERNVGKMLRDSWRYGRAAGPLLLAEVLRPLEDDACFQRLWDGCCIDFQSGDDARRYMDRSWLRRDSPTRTWNE